MTAKSMVISQNKDLAHKLITPDYYPLFPPETHVLDGWINQSGDGAWHIDYTIDPPTIQTSSFFLSPDKYSTLVDNKWDSCGWDAKTVTKTDPTYWQQSLIHTSQVCACGRVAIKTNNYAVCEHCAIRFECV